MANKNVCPSYKCVCLHGVDSPGLIAIIAFFNIVCRLDRHRVGIPSYILLSSSPSTGDARTGAQACVKIKAKVLRGDTFTCWFYRHRGRNPSLYTPGVSYDRCCSGVEAHARGNIPTRRTALDGDTRTYYMRVSSFRLCFRKSSPGRNDGVPCRL